MKTSKNKVAPQDHLPKTGRGERSPEEVPQEYRLGHFYASQVESDENRDLVQSPLLLDDETLGREFDGQTKGRSLKPARSKKRSVSRSQIVPVHSEGAYDDLDLSSGPVQLRPTSPKIFIGQQDGGRKQGKNDSSNPFPSTITNAWGSLSSLDGHVESLPSTSKEDEEMGENHSRKTTSKESLKNAGHEVGAFSRDQDVTNESKQYLLSTTDSKSSTTDSKLSTTDYRSSTTDSKLNMTDSKLSRSHSRYGYARNVSVNGTSSETNRQCKSDVGPDLLPPQSDQPTTSCDEKDDSLTHQDHIRSLQEASSATIVAVSLAPKENRSSYASQGLSKLTLAEANKRVYSFESDARGLRGPAPPDSLLMEANWLGGEGRRRKVPSGTNVLPQYIKVNSAASQTSQSPTSDAEILTRGAAGDKSSHGERMYETEEGESHLLSHTLNTGAVSDAADTAATQETNRMLRLAISKESVTKTNHVAYETDTSPREEDIMPSQSATLSPVYSSPVYSSPLTSASSSVPTPTYSSGVKSVHSSTSPRIEEDKTEALKAFNLPALKDMQVTDVYVGKCVGGLQFMPPWTMHATYGKACLPNHIFKMSNI